MSRRAPLSLRCRPRQFRRDEPVLASFCPGARTRDPEADPLMLLLLAGANEPEKVPGLKYLPREAPIPGPHSAGPVSLAHWALAAPERPAGQGEHRLGTVATAVAAAVPLALAPALAGAQETVTTPPDDADAPAQVATAEDAPAAPAPPRRDLVVPHPRALRGFDLPPVEGTPLSADDVDDCDDLPSGKPAMIPGVALTITGGVIMAAGVVTFGIITSGSGFLYPSYALYYGPYVAPFFVAGGVMLGSGIPLMIIGAVMEDEIDDCEDEAEKRGQLSLSGGPTRGGWSGQLSLRF